MKKEAKVFGSVIGSETKCNISLETQLDEHNKILKKLGKIAKTSPQIVYSCYTKEEQVKLLFSIRTTLYHRKHADLREDTAGKSHSKFNWYR